METKKQIRSRLLANRALLDCKEQFAKSNAIFLRLQEEVWFQQCTVLFAYIPYHDEVQTNAMIEYAWQHGKVVAVPRVTGETMKFYAITKWNALKSGYKGIQEPYRCEQEIIPNAQSLMLVPGVGFDMGGNRCGYGKGFYDRYLEAYSNLHTIALAYDCQICNTLPIDSHDRIMHKIVTESRVIEA